MKKFLLALAALSLAAAAAEGIVLAQFRLDPWNLAALLESLALTLGAFVALTDDGVIQWLRSRAAASPITALLLPFVMLVPYLVLALGAGTFASKGAGKLAAYIAVPTLLVFPDRKREPDRVGVRDFAAMLALGLPVSAGWLRGIWMWPGFAGSPQDIYVFRPFFCVCIGAYAFVVLRRLEAVGFRLLWNWADAAQGFFNFAMFAVAAIPLGVSMGFLHPHWNSASGTRLVAGVLFEFIGIYLTIAIPEEFLFRGVLQKFLAQSWKGSGVWALLVASAVFGASHLHHPPMPNWKYGVLAAIAGVFYGNAYRVRKRLCAGALTHALVDTAWRFWF